MNARCLLGTGAGGHPSAGGHDALYEAVLVSLDGDDCANGSHDYQDELTVKVKATAKKNGQAVKVCKNCGAESEKISIPYPKTVKLAYITAKYTGKARKGPALTVTGSNGKVIDASNYTVKYGSGRTKVGRYKVTVTFNEEYYDMDPVVKYWKIKPNGTTISKLTKAKKAITVKWKKQTTQTTGYQDSGCNKQRFHKEQKDGNNY